MTPSNSRGVVVTDHADWATTSAVVFDHLSVGFEAKEYVEYESSAYTRTDLGRSSSKGTDGLVHPP